MFVHWQMRTLQVITEMDVFQAERLVTELKDLKQMSLSSSVHPVVDTLIKDFEELDTSDKRPGV